MKTMRVQRVGLDTDFRFVGTVDHGRASTQLPAVSTGKKMSRVSFNAAAAQGEYVAS